MSDNNRRDFIRKSILTGVFAKTAISSYSALEEEPFVDQSLFHLDQEEYWKMIRKAFNIPGKRTYFNTAGLGPTTRTAVLEHSKWLTSISTIGETFHSKIEDVRKELARLLFLSAEEEAHQIGFTRNATEAANIVARSLKLKKGDEVILTNHEHVGGAAPWLMLKDQIGIKIKLVEPDINGLTNLERIQNAISKKTKVIFVSHVTCTNGMIMPVKEIVEIARENKIISCIDGAQAVGMIQVDLKTIDPDFYLASTHKWLFGPIGSGFLFTNDKVLECTEPVFSGAYANEEYDLDSLHMTYKNAGSRIEHGTQNIPQLLSLKKAIEFISEVGPEQIEERGKHLAGILKDRLSVSNKIEILSPNQAEFASAIVTFRHKDIDYLEMQTRLAEESNFRLRGIYEGGLNALRVSCAIFNTPDEMNAFADAVLKL